MKKETEKFYSNFCKMTQSKNGMWEQRFYTDGKLGPSWGYQIDETASVIYGVYKMCKRRPSPSPSLLVEISFIPAKAL